MAESTKESDRTRFEDVGMGCHSEDTGRECHRSFPAKQHHEKRPELKPGQLRTARMLIRRHCANYDAEHHGCYLLDDGDGGVCPQCISYSQICNYFRDAVLPLEPELMKELCRAETVRRCGICGKAFIPRSNRQMFCGECAKARRRMADRERKWKERHSEG